VEKFSVGDVVFVHFPFSDLKKSKLRPAVVIASVQHDDWILCQITSKSYADNASIELRGADFKEGSLKITSYIHPGKIFTVHESIINKKAGVLKDDIHALLIERIVGLISPQPQS